MTKIIIIPKPPELLTFFILLKERGVLPLTLRAAELETVP